VGRAAQGRPWLIAAIASELATGAPSSPPPPARMLDSLLELHDDCLSFYGTALGGRVARKHIAWTIDVTLSDMDPGTRRAARADICRLESPVAVRTALCALFAPAFERRAA